MNASLYQVRRRSQRSDEQALAGLGLGAQVRDGGRHALVGLEVAEVEAPAIALDREGARHLAQPQPGVQQVVPEGEQGGEGERQSERHGHTGSERSPPIDPRPPPSHHLDHGDHGERPGHARHPAQVGRVRPLQRLGQDAEADEGHHEQDGRAAGHAAGPPALPDGERHQRRRCRAACRRTRGTGRARPAGGGGATTVGSPRPPPATRRRAGSTTAGGAAPARPGARTPGPAPCRGTRRRGRPSPGGPTSGCSPTTAPSTTGPRVAGYAPEEPPEDEGEGDDQVGPEGQRQIRPARRPRASISAVGDRRAGGARGPRTPRSTG